MGRPKSDNPRNRITNIRLSEKERDQFSEAAQKLGCGSVSEYVRLLHRSSISILESTEAAAETKATDYTVSRTRPFYQTTYGKIYRGDSRAYLLNLISPNTVDLIITSPPFGLVRKKTYGNEDAERYCDWFRPFAVGFRRVLKDTGSLVIDIGGSWVPGIPTRSLYHYKLLIMLVEEYGFHLCQEHYWWNPSKLPAPAEWVNIRRIRVKDSVNCVWWLSKSPFPQASNRRVLQPYSKSMRHLLANGYKAKRRPSGHDISDKFNKDNGGSVPPNLLAIANTESSGRYQEFCRANNIPIHPARFPAQLPEYFIRFLTDPDSIVLDPFAGSCVTGMVAENLSRRWICIELSEEYLIGARSRFEPSLQPLPKNRDHPYQVSQPCSMPIDERSIPLPKDGGAHRASSVRSNKA